MNLPQSSFDRSILNSESALPLDKLLTQKVLDNIYCYALCMKQFHIECGRPVDKNVNYSVYEAGARINTLPVT